MRRHHGSVFFPLLLISAGCVGLLINVGLLPLANLTALAYLWPLLLVFLGLDIMIGYRSRWLSALIWLSAMGLMLALLLYGPSTGILPQAEVKREVLREPLGNTRTADVYLDLPGNPVTVSALSTADLLFEASISYIGDYVYDVYTSSANETSIHLGSRGLWSIFYVPSATPEADRWQISLSPHVPLKLEVDGHTGAADLDLRRLTLRTLEVNAGSGALTLILPEGGPQLKGTLNASQGPFTLIIPANASAELRLEGGSGPLRLECEEGAALRLIVEERGSGALTLPSWMTPVPNLTDTWETAQYATASRRVTITLIQDSGHLEVR